MKIVLKSNQKNQRQKILDVGLVNKVKKAEILTFLCNVLILFAINFFSVDDMGKDDAYIVY